MALEEKLLVEQSKNTQLQLEVEKLKSSITLDHESMVHDREIESGAIETLSTRTEQPSASIKAGIHVLIIRH